MQRTSSHVSLNLCYLSICFFGQLLPTIKTVTSLAKKVALSQNFASGSQRFFYINFVQGIEWAGGAVVLCFFHVRDAIQRWLKEHGYGDPAMSKQNKFISEKLRALMYAASQEEFVQLKDELLGILDEPGDLYGLPKRAEVLLRLFLSLNYEETAILTGLTRFLNPQDMKVLRTIDCLRVQQCTCSFLLLYSSSISESSNLPVH